MVVVVDDEDDAGTQNRPPRARADETSFPQLLRPFRAKLLNDNIGIRRRHPTCNQETSNDRRFLAPNNPRLGLNKKFGRVHLIMISTRHPAAAFFLMSSNRLRVNPLDLPQRIHDRDAIFIETRCDRCAFAFLHVFEVQITNDGGSVHDRHYDAGVFGRWIDVGELLPLFTRKFAATNRRPFQRSNCRHHSRCRLWNHQDERCRA